MMLTIVAMMFVALETYTMMAGRKHSSNIGIAFQPFWRVCERTPSDFSADDPNAKDANRHVTKRGDPA